MKLALLFFSFSLLALIQARTALSKFYIESCSADDKCKALLGYRVMADTKISNVVAMFGVDPDQILGANNFQISIPDPEDVIIQAREIVRIPVSCACSSGIRRTDSITYTVRADGETLQSVCSAVFSGMVTPLQMAEANSMVNDGQLLVVGHRLIIPFPCACNGGLFKGVPSAFLSYMVQKGESAFEIAEFFGTSVSVLVEMNNLLKGTDVSAGDMLEIPIPACTSSFSSGAADYGLTVPNGTYAITADGCVQCVCGYNYPRLDCVPSPAMSTGCSSGSRCSSSDLKLGEFSALAAAPSSCRVTSCSYRGFQAEKKLILTSVEKKNETACPAPSPPPTYRQYKPALTPDASPIIEPQSIISNQFTPTNTTAAPHSFAVPHEDIRSFLPVVLLALIIHW